MKYTAVMGYGGGEAMKGLGLEGLWDVEQG